MKIHKLHEKWMLKIMPPGTFAGKEMGAGIWRDKAPVRCIPAQVPGGVYDALLKAGEMKDPYWRDEEEGALKWMDFDFIFEKEFVLPADLEECPQILLHCACLDTIAWVYCNGILTGKGENMHRVYEFDLTGLLHPGINQIQICIQSPVSYIREKQEQVEVLGTADAMNGFPHIRKAHCMFGWDWGPHLPDAGIRGDICLYGLEGVRLGQVRVRQQHGEGSVILRVHPEIVRQSSAFFVEEKPFSWKLELFDPEGNPLTCQEYPGEILSAGAAVKEPRLWWPNGLGGQPLYRVRVSLLQGEQVLEVQEKKIGLRTMTVRRRKDEWGECFAHEVNGLTVFAMGADYIPEDCIYGKMNRERTRKLLTACRDAHFNCVRVWGGGWYPSDDFFDLCDELGLMVWLDFMFACATYHLDEEFDRNIQAELRDNIRRVRHHACLALYCGNNEMEQFVAEGQWVARPKHFADYFKMYEYIFPRIAEEEDGETFYWPASPSSGGSLDFPNDPDRGDVHYWEVWHGNKPFTEYRKHFFRYASEFGFESFPSEKTIESFTLPEDRNPFSYVMEKHQRCVGGNGKILTYLYQTFLYPGSMGALVYASQLLQAEAMKYGVEHFRRNRGRCMGAVFWQLNDCWPVASWSSIDYEGRWKALHYYAKRFFAPLLLSCEEESVLTQDWEINQPEKHLRKSVRFNVSNETREAREAEVRWQLRSAGGEILREDKLFISAAPLSAAWTEAVDCPDADERRNYVSFQLYENGEWISSGSVIFTVPKFFCWEDPGLTVHVQGRELVVRADAYAKSVEVRNRSDNLILEDNFFDMDPGERRIRILAGEPERLEIRSVYDIR